MTVAKPNEPELAALTGVPVRSDDEVLAAGARALELLGARLVLVTRGRRGMALFERGQRPLLLPVHGQAEAVDVTGAGDTVGAAFAVALGAGATPREAAELANVAGALVVQKQGTATVRREELRQALRARG
jgi:bifunctional ADP-heptose synthase (sugar kinase/adenylyltransferase)